MIADIPREGGPVNAVLECTLPEKILLAAYHLEESGQSPFSAEALIVSSWQQSPRTFGLKGYADLYPDANKVLACIMGEKGLARRGWLIKMGQKLYAMTREGRQIVRRLMQTDDLPPPPSTPLQLNSEQDKLAQSLLGSTAWTKFREGRKMDLNFADACRFWNINEHMEIKLLDQRLKQVGAILNEIERTVGSSDALLGNNRKVLADEVAQLGELHDYLEDRFERHLMLLRNRAERR
jgi:hypothetical protein